MSITLRISGFPANAGAITPPQQRQAALIAKPHNGAAMARFVNPRRSTVLSSPPKAEELSTVRKVYKEQIMNGAANGAAIDAETVIARLEAAGRTLLALPNTGWSTKLRTSHLDIVRNAMEAYGYEVRNVRPAYPGARDITLMDEALAWIPLIPVDRYVIRRIVGARALVNPLTGRHLFAWRRLATVLGADHKAIQRWHAQGIDQIVTRLNTTS